MGVTVVIMNMHVTHLSVSVCILLMGSYISLIRTEECAHELYSEVGLTSAATHIHATIEYQSYSSEEICYLWGILFSAFPSSILFIPSSISPSGPSLK